MVKRLYFLALLLLVVLASALLYGLFETHATVEALERQLTDLRTSKTDLEQNLINQQEKVQHLEQRLLQQQDGGNSAPPVSPRPEPEKIAYLTFDDGPTANTARILDILSQYDVKATFFVNGHESKQAKELYQRIVSEGHALGLHGYSHDYAEIYHSVDAYMNNLYRLESFLFDVTGQRPTIKRFPGGSATSMGRKYGGETLIKDIIKRLNEEGYQYFDWNVDSRDASKPVQPTRVIIDSVLNGVQGKHEANILMHDTLMKSTTVEALPAIIIGLRQQGYVFRVLSADTPAVQFRR